MHALLLFCPRGMQEVCACLGETQFRPLCKDLASVAQAAVATAGTPPPPPSASPLPGSTGSRGCCTPWQCRVSPVDKTYGLQAIMCVQCYDPVTGSLPPSPLACVTSDMSRGL